jgi:DNA-binding transcriptional LysR family regulator
MRATQLKRPHPARVLTAATPLDIRCFIAAAEELNIRRAAERLKVPQPTLTRQIRALEKRLGFDLLIRERGRITGVTAAGANYLSGVRQLLRMSDNAIQSARDIAEGKAGRLRLGVCDEAMTCRFVQILSAFAAALPCVGLDISELPSNQQASALRHNQLDLGIVSPPIDDRGLLVEKMWQEDWFVALPPGHALTKYDQLSCAHLAQTGLILAHPEVSPDGNEHVRNTFFSEGIRPNVIVQTQRRSTMMMLVASGAGVAFVPAALAAAASPGLEFRPFISRPLTICAAFRAEDPPGLAMRFLRVAHQVLCKDRFNP